MLSPHDTLDRHTVAFRLNEAVVAISSTLAVIESAVDDDPAMWVCLSHILDSLCLAWHRRMRGAGEVAKETQEDFERQTVAVPNWIGRFHMVDFNEASHVMDLHLERSTIVRRTVLRYLRAAKSDVQKLLRYLDSHEFDPRDDALLEKGLASTLGNLCLAWHLRHLRDDEIAAVAPSALTEVSSWLPPWQPNVKLVDPSTRVAMREDHDP